MGKEGDSHSTHSLTVTSLLCKWTVSEPELCYKHKHSLTHMSCWWIQAHLSIFVSISLFPPLQSKVLTE